MVTRKPVPYFNSGLAPTNTPPYPATPSSQTAPGPFHQQNVHPPDPAGDPSNPWTGEDLDRLSLHGNTPAPSLPSSLRAGPPPGYPTKTSQEKLAQSISTNPFLQKQQTGSTNGGKESSADAWGGSQKSSYSWESDTPAQPTTAPPLPPPLVPQVASPQQPSNSSQYDSNTNPWGSTGEQHSAPNPITPVPSIPHEDLESNAWSVQQTPARHAPPPPVDTTQPVLIDLEEPESPAWDEDEPSPVVAEMPANNEQEIEQIREDRHAWDESEGHPLQQKPQNPIITTQSPPPEQPGEGWNIVDRESVQGGAQQSGVVGENGVVLETFPDVEQAPALPPRRSQEEAPRQPPRPVVDTTVNQSSSLTSPGAIARKQKKETYEIKKITWHDVKSAKNPRVSPILVQNANGPCPLLALVNALTLSTPADIQTALVETLRTREQVSLGLLLDAVFDELMSGRRGDAVQNLPDVSDLYSFLITLHTGMNVNPQFIPNPPTKGVSDPRNSMSHVHPSEREARLPGTFEQTREMKLYSTFSIPLIHGWIAEPNSPAYTALNRSAKTYEDAQNLMFHEEELEYKLEREGLNFEEQSTLEDIATIKAFFASNATQLTHFGLQTITSSIEPGSVAILFRNDHFSTLYRHPDTLQLLQLVTDMGYAGHEEVVWESLMDVNGENAEFFSGDFRLVGGALATPSTYHNANEGWTAVQGRGASSSQNQNQHHTPSHSYSSQAGASIQQAPNSPSEQEDHDLALALQLQEEEEARHRAEIARRNREAELSQQYIEQQGRLPPSNSRNNTVPVTQRGGERRQSSQGASQSRGRGRAAPPVTEQRRPVIPPRRAGTGGQPVDPEAGIDVPPPSYEQAAGQAAYVPPINHPSHPNASPNISGSGTPSGSISDRRASAYTVNSQGYVQSIQSQGRGSRRSNGTGPATSFDHLAETNGRRNTANAHGDGSGKDKDCAVM